MSMEHPSDQRPRCDCCGEFLGPEHVPSQQRIQDLLDQISEEQKYREWAEEREARLVRERDRANRGADMERRTREADQWDRESKQRDLLSRLEDARRYGNEYTADEIVQKLKRLG